MSALIAWHAIARDPKAATQEGVVVLGIGNLLWADEGFGVRAVQALHRRWRFSPRVTLVDGGTQGFNLLQYVEAARRLVIFDAIDFGLPCGTLKTLRNEEVPRFFSRHKLSQHQTGFQEVLAVAEFNGRLPEDLVLIGVQPDKLDDYGGGLSNVVKAQFEPALEVALACLTGWGCKPAKRGTENTEPLLPAGLEPFDGEAGSLQWGVA